MEFSLTYLLDGLAELLGLSVFDSPIGKALVRWGLGTGIIAIVGFLAARKISK